MSPAAAAETPAGGVRRPVRIANCSGFYGDRFSAAQEVITGGAVDVLTGDYLAELTMLILWKDRRRNPDGGYAKTFLAQLEQIMGECLDRGIKVVTNAGGLNPAGLASAIGAAAARLGLSPVVAHIEGDDLIDRLPDLQARGIDLRHLETGASFADADVRPVTANAYLGGWGITGALEAGADIVITPRVTDASLVVGPCAWWFGWGHDDWDRLASAVAVGHVIECGAQATGGNYAFLADVESEDLPGFPIAEVADDGSSVITKQPGTGGAVTVGTVTAQLLYEIGSPQYLNPDVVARFDTIQLSQQTENRVAMSICRGEPPPDDLKVCINYSGGYKNAATFMLTGLDREAKARYLEHHLFRRLGGREQFDEAAVRLIGATADGPTNADATAQLRVVVKSTDRAVVGRRFSGTATSLSLSTIPGFYSLTPPQDAKEFGVYWPALIPAESVEQKVSVSNGTPVRVRDVPAHLRRKVEPLAPDDDPPPLPTTPPTTERAPLGTAFAARSGDKGGNANVGLWATSDPAYQWLAATLTGSMLTELCPELAPFAIDRYLLPNLRAVNFVIRGLLGDGVAASTRPDPQAKSLGEFVRSRIVDLPIDFTR